MSAIHTLSRKTILVPLLASGFISAQCTMAYAQAVPTSTDPGVVIRSLEEKRREPSRLEDTVTISGDKADAKGLSAEKAFTLQSIILDGTTVYKQKDIDLLAAKYLKQPVSFVDLNAVAQLITRKYREDGYMFSSAILPPQKIKGGVVHLKAIEGHITDVKVVGTFEDKENLIRNLAAKIKSAGPTNTEELERYLLLLDDLPGITARSLLKPSKTPGGGELIITIEQDKFEGSASVDNRGSDYLGPYRGTLIGAFNSVLGIHDRTTFRGMLASQTDEFRFADITHEEQIGTEGLRLKGRYAFTETEPGRELEALALKGRSRLFDLEALYPLIRGRQFNVNIISGFTALNSETDILAVAVAEDHVRYLRGGTRFDFTDSLAGINQFDLQLAKGITVFNTTSDGVGRSRANGEHNFLRANASATRIQDLWNNFSMQFSASGQYSHHELLASEEFAVGGPEFGRAYDSGEITGDRGMAGAVELRYTGQPSHEYLRSYQLYTYYDAGKVWNSRAIVGESSRASLASAGAGVRFNLIHDITGYVELDTPLTRDVNSEHDDNSRLFFNLLKRF